MKNITDKLLSALILVCKVESWIMKPTIYLLLCFIFLTGIPFISDFQRDVLILILSNTIPSST